MKLKGIICVKCGNEVNKIEGSIKRPYCKKCFKLVYHNDYDKYFDESDV